MLYQHTTYYSNIVLDSQRIAKAADSTNTVQNVFEAYLKNPIAILFVYNRKRHIVEICGNIYNGNYTSKAYKNDTIDPDAPDIDLEEIQNNVYVGQSTI